MSRPDVGHLASSVGVAAGVWLMGYLCSRFGLRWLSRLVPRMPTDLVEMMLATLRPQRAYAAAGIEIPFPQGVVYAPTAPRRP